MSYSSFLYNIGYGHKNTKNQGWDLTGFAECLQLNWICSLQTARKVYSFTCNTLDYLCKQLDIPKGTHHRAGDDAEMCARLYLRELEDI